MTGELIDEAERTKPGAPAMNHIGRWYKPWFFKHVLTAARAGTDGSSTTTTTATTATAAATTATATAAATAAAAAATTTTATATATSNSCGGKWVEVVPIRDYLMRHDRSMCMTMSSVLPFGNHPLFRYLFGWLLPPNMALLKSSHTKETREDSARMQVSGLQV